jgi:hypothetical protein
MPIGKVAKAAAKVPHYHAPAPTLIGPKIVTLADEEQYHPLVSAVRAEVTSLTIDQRKALLNARVAWVRSRRDSMRAALTAVGLPDDAPAKIAVPTAKADWPLSRSLRVIDLSFRLREDEHTHHVPENLATDRALAALNGDPVDAEGADPGKTAALLQQIRCLAEVYTRWEVTAKLTTALLGKQLAVPPLSAAELAARILTFWRIEGDLAVPPENDTLAGSDLPAGIASVPLPPGRTRLDYNLVWRPHMYSVTALFRQDTFSAVTTGLAYATGSTWPVDLSDVGVAATVGNASLIVVLAGLDILYVQDFQKRAEKRFTTDPPWTYADELSWPALNRQVPLSRPLADARAEAQADGDRRKALVFPVQVGPTASPAQRVSVKGMSGYPSSTGFSSPGVEYTALVVGEAIRYLNRLTSGPVRFGPGAAPRLPEHMVYLLYHTGHEAKGMLGSAAAYAVLKSPRAPAKAVHDALPASARDKKTSLGAVLAAIRNPPPHQTSVDIAEANWDILGPVLGDPAVMSALANYVRHAPEDMWKFWVPQRSNVIGYDHLYQHHLKVLSGK